MATKTPRQLQVRAAKMLEQRIMKGKTNAEIAKDFGVSAATVGAAMSLAAKADLIVSFEDKLVNELLPLAHNAAKSALLDGNARVAMEILKGTQILRPSQQRSAAQAADDDELTRYIAQKRAAARLAEVTIDAEFRSTPPSELAPAPTLALPPGPASRDAAERPEATGASVGAALSA